MHQLVGLFGVIALLCEIGGTISALLTPMILAHWLLYAANPPGLREILSPVTFVLTPLNQLITFLSPFPLPSVHYNNDDVSIAQAIVAGIFIGLFFLGMTIAAIARDVERRLKFQVSAGRINAFRERERAALKQQRQSLLQSQTILVYVLFPFDSNARATQMLSEFTRYGGEKTRLRAEGWLVMFRSLNDAMQYAVESAQKLKTLFGRQGALDDKPPFQLAIHSVASGDEQLFMGLQTCQRLIRNAADDQIMASDHVIKMLQVANMSKPPRFQSLGLVGYRDGQTLEIFQIAY